jgi:ribosome biogenesis GTPase A
MTKAKRAMQEDLKLVDLIIELLDARVPVSSRNPDIDRLGQGKARLVLLNKADLAEDAQTERWKQWFLRRGIQAVRLDARDRNTFKQINSAVAEACKEKTQRDLRRGIKNRPVRAMAVGIPNVGKSTFINSFAGRASAKTGNKPGVTKGNQWIRLGKSLELLDTPGILWPKFEDEQVGLHLAYIGSINDDILDKTQLAVAFIGEICGLAPHALPDRYASQAAGGGGGHPPAKEVGGLAADGQAAGGDGGHPPAREVVGLADDGQAAGGGGKQATDESDETAQVADGWTDGGGDVDTYGVAWLEKIATVRGCLKKGGVADIDKAALLLFDDYRSGRLGRITLERA